MERPEPAAGQRWRDTDTGEVMTLEKPHLDLICGAGWVAVLDGQKCSYGYWRLAQSFTNGRLEYLGMAGAPGAEAVPVKAEGPVMAEGERVGSIVYPAACLQCGGRLMPGAAFECDACPVDGYAERSRAWIRMRCVGGRAST